MIHKIKALYDQGWGSARRLIDVGSFSCRAVADNGKVALMVWCWCRVGRIFMNKSLIFFYLLFLFPICKLSAQEQPTPPIDDLDADVAESSSGSPSSRDILNGEGERGATLEQERLEATQAISRYNEKVQKLEIKEGPYNYNLSEQLLGLGDAYSKLNNHEKALQSYKRALQVYRINHGLHDLGQQVLLNRIRATNAQLNNHENLNDNQDYLLWLYRRNYAGDDPRLLPALIRVASWKLKAFAQSPSRQRVDYLYTAEALFAQSMNILETRPEIEDDRAIQFLFEIAETNIAAQFFLRSPRFVEDALQKTIDLHKQNPELPKLSLAKALVLLGDMEMSHKHRKTATEHYKKAYQTLLESALGSDVIQRLFGQPCAIHSIDTPTILARSGYGFLNDQDLRRNRLSTSPRLSTDDDAFTRYRVLSSYKLSSRNSFSSIDDSFVSRNRLLNSRVISESISQGSEKFDQSDINNLNLDRDNTQYVLFKMDINEKGRARNIEILKSNPPNNIRFRRNARERVRDLSYRPRLKNGQAVETKDFVILFRFQ